MLNGYQFGSWSSSKDLDLKEKDPLVREGLAGMYDHPSLWARLLRWKSRRFDGIDVSYAVIETAEFIEPGSRHRTLLCNDFTSLTNARELMNDTARVVGDIFNHDLKRQYNYRLNPTMYQLIRTTVVFKSGKTIHERIDRQQVIYMPLEGTSDGPPF